MDIHEIKEKFDGVQARGPNSFQCLCPAHYDQKASLTVTQEGERILFHCHAGCDTKDILDAVGLSFADIGPAKTKGEWRADVERWKGKKITAAYHYTDAAGAYLYTKVRFEDKDMLFGVVERESGKFKAGLKQIKGSKTLYHLPALIKAVAEGQTVYYVEGEKDVKTLEGLGLTATTAGGANDWRKDFAEYFKGAKVVIFPDNDAPGKKLGRTVKQDLSGVAEAVKVVPTSKQEHGDVTDWLEEGHDKEQLLKLVEESGATHVERLNIITPTHTEWLWPYYIPAGKLCGLRADGGTGKTYFSIYVAATVASGGRFYGEPDFIKREPRQVLLQNAEDGYADTIVPRLIATGMDYGDRIFRIPEENGVLTFMDDRIEQAIKEQRPALAIFDPLQAFLGADVDMHRANEVRPVLTHLGNIAENYGCTIMIIEHLSKATNQAALYRSIGSNDITMAMRTVLAMGRNPEVDGQVILAPVKNNLAPKEKSLALRIGNGVTFEGYSDLTADDILASVTGKRHKPSKSLDDAVEMLKRLLAIRGWEKLDAIQDKAKDEGIARQTLYNAKKELGLKSHVIGFGGNRVVWWAYESVTRESIVPPKQEELQAP